MHERLSRYKVVPEARGPCHNILTQKANSTQAVDISPSLIVLSPPEGRDEGVDPAASAIARFDAVLGANGGDRATLVDGDVTENEDVPEDEDPENEDVPEDEDPADEHVPEDEDVPEEVEAEPIVGLAACKSKAKAKAVGKSKPMAKPKGKAKGKAKAKAKAIANTAADNVGTAAAGKAKAKPKGKAKAKAIAENAADDVGTAAASKAKAKAKAKGTPKARAKAKAAVAAAPANDVGEPNDAEEANEVAENVINEEQAADEQEKTSDDAVPASIFRGPPAMEDTELDHVMCADCRRPCHFTKCRLLSKAKGLFRCSNCGTKSVQLRRAFGTWPTEQFGLLSEEHACVSYRRCLCSVRPFERYNRYSHNI
jgi:hypothetical protein